MNPNVCKFTTPENRQCHTRHITRTRSRQHTMCHKPNLRNLIVACFAQIGEIHVRNSMTFHSDNTSYLQIDICHIADTERHADSLHDRQSATAKAGMSIVKLVSLYTAFRVCFATSFTQRKRIQCGSNITSD